QHAALAAEVADHTAGRQADPLCDLRHARGAVPVCREQLGGGLDDHPPALHSPALDLTFDASHHPPFNSQHDEATERRAGLLVDRVGSGEHRTGGGAMTRLAEYYDKFPHIALDRTPSGILTMR